MKVYLRLRRQWSQLLSQQFANFCVWKSVVSCLRNERGVSYTRAHCKDQNARTIVVERRTEGSTQTNDEVFGADVNRATGEGLQAKDWGNVNDNSSSSSLVLAHVVEAEQSAPRNCSLETIILIISNKKIEIEELSWCKCSVLTQLIAISFSHISSFMTPALLMTMSSTLNFSMVALNAAEK